MLKSVFIYIRVIYVQQSMWWITVVKLHCSGYSQT